MPSLPKTQCSQYHCHQPALAGSSLCEQHAPPKATTDQRRASNAEYKKAAWLKIRMAQLSKEPLCAACMHEGRVAAAEHVDHLFAWNQINAAAFKLNVFQSLCHTHHSLKTALEQKGTFRHYSINAINDYSLSDYQRVINSYLNAQEMHTP
jgi:5-methylcytosine-specific restriction protein A